MLARRVSMLCVSRCSSTSATNQPALKEDKEKEEVKELKDEKTLVAKLIPESIYKFLFDRDFVPTNFGFSNKRGIDNYDPDVPVDILLKEGPSVMKQNTMMFAKEMYELARPKIEKPDMHKYVRGSVNGETIIEYDFTSDEKLKKWKAGCDSDWGQGFSKCEFFRTDSDTAIFQGTLSNRLPKDGKTVRTGWCGIRTEDKHAFGRKKHYHEWKYFSHVIVKCRGDGRSYKMVLHSPRGQDVTWFDSHSYPLHTHGGPYWQYEKIPFSRFFHTIVGRIQDDQYPVLRQKINGIGITLSDKMEGDFKLEIGFVGVYHDTSHDEKFAYETYQLPILTPKGI